MRRWHSVVTPLLLLFASMLSTTAHSSDGKDTCLTKDISNYLWGVRHPADLPADLNVPLGTTLEKCVTLTGVGKHPLSLTAKGMGLSVNNSPFVKGQAVEVKDGDTLRVRLTMPNKYNVMWMNLLNFRESDTERRRGIYRIAWITQTENTSRKPETWRVGPDRQYRQLKDVLPYIVAGDPIYLDTNATYEPVEIKEVPGSEKLPIRLIGDTDKASERPIFSGGTKRFNWTLALRASHNWIIENVVLQDGGLCFRNEANNTVLKNVLVRRCSTGILSTDRHSGNFSLYNVEVTESGGKGRSWGHAVYVASDQHAFPGSRFILKNSFLHHNKGNNVKSRSENALIEQNWIESGTDRQSRYLLELIGYDQKYDFSGQQFVVRNNTMLMRPPGLGSRTGGDGNSPSRGDTLFEHNLFLLDEDFGRTILRTFQGIGSVTMRDNAIAFIGGENDALMLVDEISDKDWREGHPIITIEGNRVTEDTELLRRDETSSGDNRKAISLGDNKVAAPVITSMEKVNALRPKEGEYVEVKAF